MKATLSAKQKKAPAFVINSNKTYRDFHWEDLVRKGVACTGGDIEYGERLRKLLRGSRLFLYVNRIGIVAEGTVVSEWNGRANRPSLVWKRKTEYSVGVRWTKRATENQAVSLDELRRIGLPRCRHTLFSVESGVAGEISAMLSGRIRR